MNSCFGVYKMVYVFGCLYVNRWVYKLYKIKSNTELKRIDWLMLSKDANNFLTYLQHSEDSFVAELKQYFLS